MDAKVANLLEELIGELLSYRDPKQALPMKKYMKNRFQYLGIKAPLRKEISKPFIARTRSFSDDELMDLVDACWKNPFREFQYIGMMFLEKRTRKMDTGYISFTQELIVSKSWWDTVDFLAASIAGPLFRKFPMEGSQKIAEWRNGNDIWLRRTCLIFQLKYRHETDFDLLKSLIVENLNDREFFIQKACGWALREYSKHNAKAVKEFIEGQPGLSNLARREGMKWLERQG